MSKRRRVTDLGTFQLGDWVPIVFNTFNSSDVRTAPTTTSDKAPVGSVWLGSTTKIENIKFNIIDPVLSPALFTHRIRLSSSYSVGNYTVCITYATGGAGFFGRHIYTFRVVAGGSATGGVQSACVLERPDASHYVHVVDSGAILSGRNPY